MANATFSLKDGLGSIDMSFRNDGRLDRKTVLGAIGSVLPGESAPVPIINCVVNAAPAQSGVMWDTVAIYDDFGIPSIMHRFRKVRNCDLFAGGSDKTHSAFIIGGDEYEFTFRYIRTATSTGTHTACLIRNRGRASAKTISPKPVSQKGPDGTA